MKTYSYIYFAYFWTRNEKSTETVPERIVSAQKSHAKGIFDDEDPRGNPTMNLRPEYLFLNTKKSFVNPIVNILGTCGNRISNILKTCLSLSI
jgi:hypothetical protein